jgi:uncharacterized protein
VPLRSAGGALSSAAARSAFGAVGIARPDSADELALLLLHEFQHVKLGALLDMYDLVHSRDGRLYAVAWRADPRPAEGALQGAYAHLAVTDFWRARGRHSEAGRWGRAVAETVDALTAAGALTTDGVAFARRMRASVSRALDERDHPSCASCECTRSLGSRQPGELDA